MNSYIKITVSTIAVLGISAGVYFGAEAYNKSKEVKPLNSVEAINVYMSNPVQVNQDLVLKVPTIPVQRDSLQSLETIK